MSAKAYVKVTSSLWKSVNKVYVKVTPTLWKSVNKIYVKVTSTLWKSSFGGSDEPVQITKPTLTGTGRVGTTVTRSSGTYSNYNSLITRIFYTTEVAEQVSASTVDPSGGGLTATNPYTILQSDATEPPYYFYARDEVLGVDNETYYYYSTPPIEANISQIEDNFNRTVAGGLGTASGGYIYSGPSRSTSSWSVDGSRASNSSNGSGYPLQTVTINSNNQNVSVDTFGGGLGVAVWASSANSWWAAIPTYSYELGQGTDYTCTSNQTGTEEECDAVTYVSGGSNPQSTGYMISDVGKRCTACTTTSSSYNYECTNNVRVTNAGDPCPEYENWSSAMPGGENTVCSGSCTESYEYVCASEWSMNQPDCTGQLLRPDPTGPNQLCACQSYEETVAICPSAYNNDGPCDDANIGGTAIGDQCSTCNPSTTYAYSYRSNTLTTTYACNNDTSCSGAGCCDNITYRPDPNGSGQRCSACDNRTSTSYTYSYSLRASTGTTTYPCDTPVSGSASCPTYRPDPTGSGQRCSDSCTPSTNTTYPCTGSVSNSTSCPDTGPNAGDRCGTCTESGGTTFGLCRSTTAGDPVCPSCPGGTTSIAQYNCTTGNRQCRCVRPIRYSYSVRQSVSTTTYSYTVSSSTTTYLCDVPVTGSGQCPTSLPDSGSGPGQRCTDCISYSSTSYVSYYTLSTAQSSYLCENYTTGQSSCPGAGSGPGQRCTDCTVTTSNYYKTRIAEIQTRYKTKTSTTLTYNNYKTRKYLGAVVNKSWKEVEETTGDKYTYNANINIYSYSSGTLTLKSSAIVSTYAAQAGTEFNSTLYPDITTVTAVTTGNSINATGWVGSEFNVASSTNTETKGTAVGVVGIPVTENIGTKLDNFSA
jgi:hypothetical protein